MVIAFLAIGIYHRWSGFYSFTPALQQPKLFQRVVSSTLPSGTVTAAFALVTHGASVFFLKIAGEQRIYPGGYSIRYF